MFVICLTLEKSNLSRLRLKCDGTHAETGFRLSAKRTSPFKSAGVSLQSTTGSQGVRNSSSNAGYMKFRGSVKSTGYPLHLPVSPSLPPVRHRVPSRFNWTLPIVEETAWAPEPVWRVAEKLAPTGFGFPAHPVLS